MRGVDPWFPRLRDVVDGSTSGIGRRIHDKLATRRFDEGSCGSSAWSLQGRGPKVAGDDPIFDLPIRYGLASVARLFGHTSGYRYNYRGSADRRRDGRHGAVGQYEELPSQRRNPKKYTPAQKATEIAKAIDAAKIPGVKTAVNNNVVTITGATKFAYFDNSEETGLKLASAGPATNNGVIVTLGYTGTPSEDDASYVAAFGDSAFIDTASTVFPEPPSLDTLLGAIYADLKANLSTGLQSRLTLDLSSDTIAFTFPSSSDQFVQNYTSDGELTANQSIEGVVPEPSTWAMLLIGFAGLAFAGHLAGRRSPHGARM